MTVAAEIGVGMARAEAGAGEPWSDEAYRAVEQVARSRARFHVNDVWAAGLREPENGPRAIGPVIRRAERNGLIEKAGVRAPSDKARDLPMHVWVSRVYGR